MAKKSNEYTDALRRIKSQLLVSTLQRKKDQLAFRAVKSMRKHLKWEERSDLMIDDDVWKYVVNDLRCDPKLVFCHPHALMENPLTSFYYRGLAGLSIKAAKDYFGAVENLESGSTRTKLGIGKAKIMAQTYNTFICSIIKNSTDWTLENGKRTIIATLGITLDGVMRNKVGEIAEDRTKQLLVEWLADKSLITKPRVSKNSIQITNEYSLVRGVTMRFGSEPDVSFASGDTLLAVLEIKGGIDPAGALERYGAARKSFEHAMRVSPKCKNFYLGGVFTAELDRRMNNDRLVEKSFNIIDILQQSKSREEFFLELFHHTLRLV
jgi:hypothetical protein